MNAFEMLHEYGRMCQKQRVCATCPLNELKSNKYCDCQECLMECPEKAAEIIEKWSKEHPQKTRLQDFLEKYPNAPIGICPQACCVNLGYIKTCPGTDCEECWNKPIDE